MTQPANAATTPNDPPVSLAAAGAGQQIAPPYAGGTDGIVRSQIYPPSAPPNTWMAWRANRAGEIVAQLGSKPTSTRRRASILVGYQFEQTLARPGNYFWTAALRTVALSRLPQARAYTYGFMTLSSQPYLYTQPLVAGRTHLFTVGQYQHPAGKHTIRCGVIVSVDFGPGQTAYVEAIATLQSLALQSPSLFAAEGDVARAAVHEPALSLDDIPTASRMLEVEVEVEGDGDEALLEAFDGLD